MPIIVLTHRKEILTQNANELYHHAGVISGIYSASLGRKDIRLVTFAAIQSIHKKEIDAGLVIIDEAHLISPKDSSMYQKFLARVKARNKNLRIMGLTATPMRQDQGSLIGEGTLFDTLAYDISIKRLIGDGFLSPLVSKVSSNKVDYSGVGRVGYDYNQGELEKLLCPLTPAHCAEIIAKGVDRKHWLIFCSGVLHSKEVAENLTKHGIPADYVTGDMIPMIRDKKIEDFKNGKIRALCNCDILTTGFNFPGVDLLVLLRATRSCSLYIQIVGRGSRTAKGKSECLVLDFGGNVERHGPVDCISITHKKGDKKAGVKASPTKACLNCGRVVAIQTRVCPECGTPFPIESLKEKTASEASLISEPELFDVESMRITIHEKEGKVPSLFIRYYTPRGPLMEFLCFDHEGYAAVMARRKWTKLGGKSPSPLSVVEAEERKNEIPQPAQIKAQKDGKWWRIIEVIGRSEKEIEAKSWLDEVGL